MPKGIYIRTEENKKNISIAKMGNIPWNKGKKMLHKMYLSRRGRGKLSGLSITKEYNTYLAMKSRCYNEKNTSYRFYGGRGIKVCDRWLESFYNFLYDMGKKPNLDYSIDRIDVNGDYAPNNCRWADRITQNNNRRNKNKDSFLIKLIDGERLFYENLKVNLKKAAP